MKCPHCNKEIHYEEEDSWIYNFDRKGITDSAGYEITHGFCPACKKLIIIYREGECVNGPDGSWFTNEQSREILYPKGYFRPLPEQVTYKYVDDYNEASAVLSLSPKASAAISRRLLQNLLRDECKIKPSTLAKEIDEFLKKSGVPSYLSQAIDAVRNVGNFAAHPSKDTNTGAIVDVKNGEAEWLLDVLDAMFDYLFVQPSILAERKKTLNEKLEAIGKPPMK